MSENRKYYYMKLKENFFTDAKMVILESMQDGLLYSNLLLKMYLMSLKYNGILMLNDHLPPYASNHRHLYPTSNRHGGTGDQSLFGVWFCGDIDGWKLLYGGHPAFDRAIFYRGRAQAKGADALEAAKSSSVRAGGQMSTRD